MCTSRFLQKVFLFFFVFCLLAPSAQAADPATSFPEPTSTLIPVMKSVAELKENQVQMWISQADLSKATVDIQYVIHNPSNEKITLPVTFPYQNFDAIKEFQVLTDGKPITLKRFTEITDQAKYRENLVKYGADKWLAVDPITGQVEEKAADLHTIEKVMVLPLTIAAKQEITGTIHYIQSAGIQQKNEKQTVMAYQYLLLPAASWRQLDMLQLRVIAPKDTSFAATLPLKKSGSAGEFHPPLPQQVQSDLKSWDVWELKFNGVPSKNLSFSVMEKGSEEGSDQGAFTWMTYLFMAIAAVLLLMVLISKLKKQTSG
ncbi:hypothetical protein ACTID9_26180 [Brevibacillus fluminis]|uniref:hypothetical protein n=1 Tax=Brevibacillus fluminis TaxID=511487 RepID=UPI003F8B6FD7